MKKIIITIFIAFTSITCSASVANYNSLQPTIQIVPPRVIEKNTTETVYVSTPTPVVEQEPAGQIINYNEDVIDSLNQQLRTSKTRISNLEQALNIQNTNLTDLKSQLQEANNKIASFKPVICPKVETPKKIEKTIEPIEVIPTPIVEDKPITLPKKESVFDRIINWINKIKYGQSN